MIYTLNACKLEKKEIGNKAYYLRKLMKLGLKVPDAIILPISFCGSSELPQKLKDFEILLKKYLPSESGWAVRSSSVNEDSFKTAMAGKFLTEIIDSDCRFNQAVMNVIQSADTENEMAVIVQKLINPDFAGVTFSKNPITNDENIVIEMVKGKGEFLVDRIFTPWTYSKGNWEQKNKPDIPGSIIEEIKNTVSKLRHQMGFHVDLEFCVQNNIVYWLQLRPVTISKIEMFQKQHFQEINLSGGWNLLDQCTEPLVPLTQKLDSSGLLNSPNWNTTFINNYPYIKLNQPWSSSSEKQHFQEKDILEDWYYIYNKYSPIFDEFLIQNLKELSLGQLWDNLFKRISIFKDYCKEYMNKEWLMNRRKASDVVTQCIKEALGENTNTDAELAILTQRLNTLTTKKHKMLNNLITQAYLYPDFYSVITDIEHNANHPWIKIFKIFVHEFGYESPHPVICHLPTLAEEPDDLLFLIQNMLEKGLKPTDELKSDNWKEHALLIESKLTDENRDIFRKNLQTYRDTLLRTEDDDYLLQKGIATVRLLIKEIGIKLKEKNYY
ncbi:PEP/pyruvate-binding domain-containing protein [Bacillus cereus]